VVEEEQAMHSSQHADAGYWGQRESGLVRFYLSDRRNDLPDGQAAHFKTRDDSPHQ
jgi:hypothetical protein